MTGETAGERGAVLRWFGLPGLRRFLTGRAQGRDTQGEACMELRQEDSGGRRTARVGEERRRAGRPIVPSAPDPPGAPMTHRARITIGRVRAQLPRETGHAPKSGGSRSARTAPKARVVSAGEGHSPAVS